MVSMQMDTGRHHGARGQQDGQKQPSKTLHSTRLALRQSTSILIQGQTHAAIFIFILHQRQIEIHVVVGIHAGTTLCGASSGNGRWRRHLILFVNLCDHLLCCNM